MPTLIPSRRQLADKSLVCVFFPAWSIPSSAMRRVGKRQSKPFGLLITLSEDQSPKREHRRSHPSCLRNLSWLLVHHISYLFACNQTQSGLADFARVTPPSKAIKRVARPIRGYVRNRQRYHRLTTSIRSFIVRIAAPQVLILKIASGTSLNNGDVQSFISTRVQRATNNFLRPHPLLLRRLGVIGRANFHFRT